MRVDVLITGTPPGAPDNQGPQVKTLLQNVQVLSAGQNITQDEKGTPVQVPVVNLLVSPEQAEILSLASNETRIQLVLRNPLDRDVSKTDGSSVSGLFTGVKKTPQDAAAQPRRIIAAVKPPPPPVAKAEAPLPPGQYVIEVINGARKEQSKFAKPEEAKLAKPEEAKP
jgi:pilus assembly protein CpaB